MSAASRSAAAPALVAPHIVPNDLGRWDQARPGDLMLVPIWTDVRPLRGASGLLDWRMCGRLSSFMLAGKVTGAEGEQTLFPSGGRLVWRLVLAVGAGARADFSEKRLRALVKKTLGTLKGLGASRIAMALPARDPEAAPAPAPPPATVPAGVAKPAAHNGADASAQTQAHTQTQTQTQTMMSARTALEHALAEIDAHPGIVSDLTVLVPAAAQKEVAEAIRLRAVRS